MREDLSGFQVSKHRRAIRSTVHYCKINQYYDKEEGRCLGVPGGGRMLHVNNEQSCGINLLKAHCTSSSYYYVCKPDKTILAQCANGQFFSSRLQRCGYNNSNQSTSITIRPESESYNHVQISSCTRPGRFPIPHHCSMFYTCETNGHRLFQSVFKCPQNMGYREDAGTCVMMPNCNNDNSVDSAICMPDLPYENIQSLNKDIEENIEGTSDTTEQSQISNLSDLLIKEERKPESNENLNSRIDNTPTPTTIIDSPLSVNEDNSNLTDDSLSTAKYSSTNSHNDISILNDSQPSFNPLSYISNNNEYLTPLEDVTLPQEPLTASDKPDSFDIEESSIIPDKYYKSTMLQDIDVTSPVTSSVLVDPNQSYMDNPDFVPQTINNASQFDSIIIQSTSSTIQAYSTRDLVDISETVTSTADGASSSNADTQKIFEELQNENRSLSPFSSHISKSAPTIEFDDATHSITTPLTSEIQEFNSNVNNSNINSEMIETMTSSTINTLLKLDESMQSMITALPNSNIKFINQNLTSNTNHSTDGLSGLYSSLDDSKIADADLRMLHGIENVNTQYSSKSVNGLDLIPTTVHTLIPESVTMAMNSTNLKPVIQNLPDVLDTDSTTKKDNDNDNT